MRLRSHSKKELQAELESLRQQVTDNGTSSPLRQMTVVSPNVNTIMGPSTALSGDESNAQSSLTPASLPQTSFNVSDVQQQGHLQVSNYNEFANAISPTLSRSLVEVDVAPDAIDACFDLQVPSPPSF